MRQQQQRQQRSRGRRGLCWRERGVAALCLVPLVVVTAFIDPALPARGGRAAIFNEREQQQGRRCLTRRRSVLPEAPPSEKRGFRGTKLPESSYMQPQPMCPMEAQALAGRQQQQGAVEEDEEHQWVDPWEGRMHGFDWQLERARRTLEGPAFSPFRMNFWKPDVLPADGEETGSGSKKPGEVSLFDTFKIFATNTVQMISGAPRGYDGAPVAEVGKYTGSWTTFLSKVMSGQLEELAGGPLFLLLAQYYHKHGPVYKLMFGPRSFMVVSDPVMVRHVLKTNSLKYDKGVLAEILEPIMGKGLIPADPITWKTRRRAIVPGFHSKWLNRMVQLFSDCSSVLVDKLDKVAADHDHDHGHGGGAGHNNHSHNAGNSNANGNSKVVDMETLFCSVSLDIIGKAVFNYDFGSVTTESPVIKSVYSTLREAEHRSMSFVPYWKLPLADRLLPDQVEFKRNMRLLNDVLNTLIAQAVATAEKADVDELTYRDYDQTDDASLLRFLVDMRGENTTSRQLRDDLMTMLIAGHETSAAVLTWSLFELSRHPEALEGVRAEVDAVLGDRIPTYEDVKALQKVRFALIEALRLYPEPPILIRRALEEDVLPQGGSDVVGGVKLMKGTDVFISTWSLHRSPQLWDKPDTFEPTRWLRPKTNPGVLQWAGFKPELVSGLYPNEVASDFAFLPFGGGARKCIGDQFAIMETTVILAMLLRRFDFRFATSADAVGMRTGATIHTENGLNMKVIRRKAPPPPAAAAEGEEAGAAAAEVTAPREAAVPVYTLRP